ncbi:MAG: phosphatase PAP2 family protein [Tannerella sp.]|jgi:undecaprenyl-diphosphatase|nr:phosphatase PAP2 family protein [Tannerella sp.]
MFEKIIPYEENLFFLINHAHTAFWDNVMWLYSDLVIWIPLALLVIFTIVYKTNHIEYLLILLSIVLVFCICDQLSTHIIKPLIARPRPTHYPTIMEHVHTLYGYSGGRYGFISGHAANSFGFAMFTALLFRNKFYSVIILLWAVIISYSRVYLGVHFFSDVVGGMIIGIIIGYLIYKFYLFLRKQFIEKESKEDRIYCYSIKRINYMTSVIVVYVLLISAFSGFIIQIVI